MWLEQSCAVGMFDTYSHKNTASRRTYVQQLDEIDEFPSGSFYQIQLDVPRLALNDE